MLNSPRVCAKITYMKEYDILMFDLDGTLTEPAEGITNSVMYALKKFGIEPPERRELYKFIGPPLIQSFEEFCGFSRDKATLAVKYYREYFAEKGIFENRVYDGIFELLTKLKEHGKRLIVATSKPQQFAERILKKFNLYCFFEYVCGATLDETRTKKSEVIEHILKQLNVSDRSRIVMVGDREHDILGATKNGVDSIGVLYGYGSRKELESAEATYIAGTVEDLSGILCKK